MSMVIHEVILQGKEPFIGKLPTYHLGLLFSELSLLLRESSCMAFCNRSKVRGAQEAWLKRVSDIRFLGHGAEEKTILFFEAQPFGEAAPEVYSQGALFPEDDDRPRQEDTAFDILGDVLADIQNQNADSKRYDESLLGRITKFSRILKKSPLCEVDFESRRFPKGSQSRLTPELVKSAEILLGKTPTPQAVRIVGQLEGLVASTQRFYLLLDTGERIVGGFSEKQSNTIQELSRKRVLVTGKAHYRASGRLLQIEAGDIRLGEKESKVFSRIPSPRITKLEPSKLRKPQSSRSGLAAIIGKWPGNETEEEIQGALESLS